MQDAPGHGVLERLPVCVRSLLRFSLLSVGAYFRVCVIELPWKSYSSVVNVLTHHHILGHPASVF